MNNIHSAARFLIEKEGSIGYIIDLLEDPKDARYNLKPGIDQVRVIAGDFQKNAKAIIDKFQYWFLLICHLRRTILSQKSKWPT